MGKRFTAGQAPKIFLTGPVRIGKSTVIDRALTRLPFTVGGIRTRRVPAVGDRSTYVLEDVMTGMTVEFARGDPDGVTVHVDVFETTGVEAVRRSMEQADLTLLDELGRMELDAKRFQRTVFTVLEGPRGVLGVVKAERNPFLDAVRSAETVEVLEVRRENRDRLVDVVVEKMSGLQRKRLT